jgi:hypothetical protein
MRKFGSYLTIGFFTIGRKSDVTTKSRIMSIEKKWKIFAKSAIHYSLVDEQNCTLTMAD